MPRCCMARITMPRSYFSLSRNTFRKSLTLNVPDADVTAPPNSLLAFVPSLRVGRESAPHGEDLPDTLEETIVGGIFWVIYQRIVLGQTDQIEALLPDLVDFALTPYIGAESAQRATARL